MTEKRISYRIGSRGVQVACLCMLLFACASPVKKAEKLVVQEDWLKAVIEYRKAYNKDPDDVEFKSRLRQMELKAADYYYQRGIRYENENNLDVAILHYQKGLTAMSEHSKLLQAMNQVLAKKESNSLYLEGLQLQKGGKNSDAKRLFSRAKQVYPKHEGAAKALLEIEKIEAEEQGASKLALSSTAPITLNFRRTNLRTAFEFIAKSFGVNVIFDDNVKDSPVTLFAKDATFDQALSLMFATTKTFYKKVGPNTILIAPDSKDKRGQYEDYLIRTFQLTTIKAKEMNDILKGLMSVNKVIVNEQLNALVIRDTAGTIAVIEKLIEANDRKRAEMILDVEILEVNRQKAENLGLDLGNYQVTAAVPSPVPAFDGTTQAIKDTATLTLPSLTFRFYKQDVDAKTLANPKVRVISGEKAKIHIGDRVPLRSSTITESTGQVRTTFEYKEIGIRLDIEPQIHLDNSMTIKLGLEVSTLGENLGTAEDPAFRIGTRNADSHMLLRDGETAILGGLIRDEERTTQVKIPVLGDIPAVGKIFTSHDGSKGRTDVLLTITPRVVRSWDIPDEKVRQFYSGTVNRYTDKSLFASLERSKNRPRIVVGESTGGDSASLNTPASSAVGAVLAKAIPSAPLPLFSFSESIYKAKTGKEVEILLVGENLGGVTEVPIEVLFNTQLLEFVRSDSGEFATKRFKVSMDSDSGLLRAKLKFGKEGAPKGKGTLARVVLRPIKPGISYLVYRSPSVKNAAGEEISAQVRASRIVIK